MRFLNLALAALPAAVAAADPLKLASKHQGTSFFDGWNVNASAIDPTEQGAIHYVDQATALSAGLLSVNKAGNAILKVDNTTDDPAHGINSTFGRNTVMVISKEAVHIGSLVVIDAVHIPFGCSVWPAFWTLDSVNGKQTGGEIDIIEPVNLMANNLYSLHANPGCTLASNTSLPFSGNQQSTNCDFTFETTGNQGCIIQEKASKSSLGPAFAQNGGGVYAMYWSAAGIQMWFFERSQIPADLTSEAPNPSAWSTPSASYPASGCDPAKFFNPQNMILNIDICGLYAGNPSVYTSTGCTGVCTDMVKTGSNYDNAYWEIGYVKTFTAAGNASASSGAGPSGASSSHAAGATGTAGSGSGQSGAGKAAGVSWAGAALLAGAAALFA